MASKDMAADMKALHDLFTRGPSQARVELHVERLLAGWRETLGPDAYAARLDELCEGLGEGIEQTAEAAGDIDPASKAETRQAKALLETMRVALAAARAGELVAV